jgi:peroxiredoxin
VDADLIRKAIERQAEAVQSLDLRVSCFYSVDEAPRETPHERFRLAISGEGTFYWNEYYYDGITPSQGQFTVFSGGRQTRYSPSRKEGILEPGFPDFVKSQTIPTSSLIRVWDEFLVNRMASDSIDVLPERQDVGGHSCVVVAGKVREDPDLLHYRLYLDPEMDYVVRAVEELRAAGPEPGLTARRKLKEYTTINGTRVPTLVETSAFSAAEGTVLTRSLYRTEQVHINEPIDESMFVLDFPPGTQVWIMPDRTDYVAGESAAGSAVTPGDRAPELLLEGGFGLRLADYRGRQVVLAFCSISSKPCADLLLKLRDLQQELGADKLGVIAVQDTEATWEQIEGFRQASGIEFPILRVPERLGETPRSPTGRAYGIVTVPTVVLIDAEGKVSAMAEEAGIPDLLRGLRPAQNAE